jgi:curved DNA-binding protein CbpA
MEKYLETLGLQDGASQEEIQTAYDKLSKELNPSNNDNQEFFVEEYKKVQDAYEALSNSSILATEKGAKSYKNEAKESEDMSPKSLNNTLIKRHNKLRIKQNITILFLIFSIGFNVFTYIKVQGDNNAISVSKSYMNQAEDYSEDARIYRNQAEQYMQEASSYMYGAEEHSDNSYYYMNRAEEHSNNAYYYSNQ